MRGGQGKEVYFLDNPAKDAWTDANGLGTGGTLNESAGIRLDDGIRPMTATGSVQESHSGTTYVAFPADQAAFQAQAAAGSIYAEFDVPRDSVKLTQQGWAKILGPNTVEARFAAAKGRLTPQMPSVENIQQIATK